MGKRRKRTQADLIARELNRKLLIIKGTYNPEMDKTKRESTIDFKKSATRTRHFISSIQDFKKSATRTRHSISSIQVSVQAQRGFQDWKIQYLIKGRCLVSLDVSR
ncbi:uncharacterized protein [Acropora muricata]|uniref:uncharacterized protein n=1 Tax=Acropora muricata TaxID=159855 RepID=UPI0034E3F9A1